MGNSPIELVDPGGLEEADSTEKWNDIVRVGYWNSYMGYRFAQEALRAAQEWAKQHNFDPTTLHNGAPDAFRHCFWSCTMAKYLGQYVAEVIGDEHEMEGRRHGQPNDEEQMDRANNLIGRTCANRKDKNCWDACTDAYNRARLFGLGAQPLKP